MALRALRHGHELDVRAGDGGGDEGLHRAGVRAAAREFHGSHRGREGGRGVGLEVACCSDRRFLSLLRGGGLGLRCGHGRGWGRRVGGGLSRRRSGTRRGGGTRRCRLGLARGFVAHRYEDGATKRLRNLVEAKLCRWCRYQTRRLEFNTEASSDPRLGPTSKRVKRTRGERAVAMASRKRTLLKVIILGDSGCVPAAIPPALDAPTTSRHFSVFQDFSPGGYARRGDATPARGFDRAPATGDVASSRQRAHRMDPRSEPARAERCPAARRPTDPRSRPPPSSRTPAQKTFEATTTPPSLTLAPSTPHDPASARRA